jgi:hypothetical protein
MRKLSICILVCVFNKLLFSQSYFPQRLQISTGVALPANPPSFYDYWKNGIGVQISGVYQNTGKFSPLVSVEYERFWFDKSRFFKKIKVNEKKTNLEGASTNIISVSAKIQYRVPGYETVLPYGFIGVGGLYTSISETRIEYLFRPIVQKSTDYIVPTIPIGFFLEIPNKKFYDILIEVKHQFALKLNPSANSDYTSIHIGIFVDP